MARLRAISPIQSRAVDTRRATRTGTVRPKRNGGPDGPRVALNGPGLTTLAALALALTLAARCLRWPFLWDDFDFLGRAQSLRLQDLLPKKSVVFYRPISREAYFWILSKLGGTPFVGHLLAIVVLTAILFLLGSFIRKLAGDRASLIGGMLFVANAGIPLALGWVSGIQDLACTLFAILALRFQIDGKTIPATLAMAAALLSKETALFLFPALVAIPFLQRRSPATSVYRPVAGAILLIGAWLLIHPWTQTIMRGGRTAAGTGGEHLAIRGMGALHPLLRGLGLTLNIPLGVGGVHLPGPNYRFALVATGIVILAVLMQFRRSQAFGAAQDRLAWIIGSLVLVGSLVGTSLVVDAWSPYYACVPAVGLSIIAGPLLARSNAVVVIGVLLTALWFGVVLRNSPLEPTTPSEVNFETTANALQHVEAGFKSLHPTLPPNSQVYVSVQARGHGGLYEHLYRYQPLRVWYRQPGIWVLDPDLYRPGGGNQFLFWIDPQLNLFEINLATLEPRGPTQTFNLAQYQKALRGYAFGLAGAGETHRAVQIITRMPEPSKEVWAFDQHIAAMLLFAAHEDSLANQLLAKLPAYDRETSLKAASAVLVEPVPGLDLDLAAMRAFQISDTDPEALRALMLQLEALGSRLAARRFAGRLLALIPSDKQAQDVLQRTSAAPTQELTQPMPYELPQ